ncbi:hypothetical protein BGW80DRAFT_1248654 [Lactifluus volemus]|nr:hypothetical protein BGW80DRAFT_1248654 [Lactifluus volemus]
MASAYLVISTKRVMFTHGCRGAREYAVSSAPVQLVPSASICRPSSTCVYMNYPNLSPSDSNTAERPPAKAQEKPGMHGIRGYQQSLSRHRTEGHPESSPRRLSPSSEEVHSPLNTGPRAAAYASDDIDDIGPGTHGILISWNNADRYVMVGILHVIPVPHTRIEDVPPQPPTQAAISIVYEYSSCIKKGSLRGLRKGEGGGLIVNGEPRVYITS